MAFLGQEEQIREFQDRFKFLYTALFLGLGILISRLIFLQILRGDLMRNYSEENRIKRVKIAAPRGMIFDRNHKLLIDNRPDFDLEIIPQYLRESKQEKKVLSMLSRILKMPESEIQENLDKAKSQPAFLPVKIKTDLTRDEVAQIEVRKIDMPGIEVKEEIKRTNIYGEIAAHLLGYIGEVNSTELPLLNKLGQRYRLGDSIGRFGLEQRMEDSLRGLDGENIREVDALGRVKLDRTKSRVLQTVQSKAAVPGKNLILSIDQDLQEIATKSFGDKIGSVVALDPRNGEILAMLSRPSFDPTTFSRGIPTKLWSKLLNNENHPLRDKTIQDHYSPGSVFKVVTAIAGLEEGVIDENTKFHCPGVIKIGNRLYHCHSKHGEINVVRAITQSCDVFFYRVAQKLKSVDDIAKWAKILGLGKKTGINLAGEVPGLIPTEAWKKKRFNQEWNAGETATVAIGQSFVLTTTLQLANLYAALGNGGTLYRPFIVKKIESSEGAVLKEFQPEILSQVRLSPKTVELVKQGLWGVVNSPIGTAFSQRLPGMDFVGKTGTVQVIRLAADKIYTRCESMKFYDRHNAVFVGFAPVKNPTIAVAIVGEHACHGATGAAPIARAVIKKYLEKTFPDVYGEKALATRLKAAGQEMPKDLGISSAAPPEDEGFADAEEPGAPNSTPAPPPSADDSDDESPKQN
ncbi:MAG: penicillin-binding protein 2 [Bdellovibrionia bacterium]